MLSRTLTGTLLVVGACAAARAQSRLHIEGGISAAEALRETLRDGFQARYADVDLVWESTGSDAAFSALFAGDADMVVSSRTIRTDEIELARRLGLEIRELVLALDGIAVIVHPDNDVASLSMSQLEVLVFKVPYGSIAKVDRCVLVDARARRETSLKQRIEALNQEDFERLRSRD